MINLLPVHELALREIISRAFEQVVLLEGDELKWSYPFRKDARHGRCDVVVTLRKVEVYPETEGDWVE